ncbi:MAG: hypothetical protein LBK76_05890, partial [Verrucomicrobiales bacterium]|nr:hypothetical protein [Verrucomicrobiales bacterium]
MKTHKLTLLLTLLPALTLTVFADNKVVTSGTVVESGSTYASVSNQAALQVSGSETLYEGANLTLSATFNTGNGKYGAFADNQARLVLSGGTITTSGSSGAVGNGGHALYVTGSATARAEQIDIRTAGDEAFGIWAINTATLSLRDAVIETTGNGGRGVYLSLLATGTLTNIDIRTTGSNGVGVYTTNAQATLLDVTIDTTGDHGVGIDSWGSDSTISGTRVTVNTAGVDAHGILVVNGGTVMLRDSAVTTRQAAVINIYDSTYRPGSGAPSRVILSGGTYDANGNALVGARIANDSSTALDTANAIVEIEHATVSGAQLLNNQLATGTIALTLTDVDATNAGGITVSGSNAGVTTVTVNAGSGVNGAVINSGSGALTVNLNNSALTGDVTNTGAGTLTIILDNDSVGTGGFAGGNLITGSDSAWTFDKDSHGNYGENHGVWNIGDYAVTFDNLTHSGTVTISVNSDTGDGGSITITDTADGEGTVHINTTGNGQLNPNDVLPGIVSGDGTEHWQWDPIDWGIDTIIKDGDHFIKSGVSPAGAVLNSSVAIQQAMWFAQQNSLLKRMGELRYGARASRPLAGETPAFHIIENLWLRSYGQQLNVGSQVSGKAYEQLIYGVDLGTDHKFTLSADSDLYLGVYAGYGRSDLDYRTPGTDGEIN